MNSINQSEFKALCSEVLAANSAPLHPLGPAPLVRCSLLAAFLLH